MFINIHHKHRIVSGMVKYSTNSRIQTVFDDHKYIQHNPRIVCEVDKPSSNSHI